MLCPGVKFLGSDRFCNGDAGFAEYFFGQRVDSRIVVGHFTRAGPSTRPKAIKGDF